MGDAAAERCDDFGWHPRGRVDPTLVAETAMRGRFGVGHAWSRSAGYSLTTAPERTYLVLTVEGGFEFSIDGTAVRTEPGSLILLDGEVPTTARTFTDTARYVWYLEPSFLHPRRARYRSGEPIATGGASMQTLIAMTNTILQTPSPRSATAGRHLALGFENLLVAALQEAGTEQDHTRGRHREGVFMASMAAIEAHFRDPGFDVTRLARELSVSVRSLHAAFADMGSTPRREIERRRVTEANHLSALGGAAARDVAEQSGFSSARQLARALGRAGTPGDTTPT